MPARSQQSRRISSLLGQRRVSDVVMVVSMSVALLFGLVGFAVHALWLATVIVLAVGLGYVVANARQDRREAIDRRREHDERTERLGQWPFGCRDLDVSPLGLDGPDRRRTHVLAGACVPIRMFGRLAPSGRLAMGRGCRPALQRRGDNPLTAFRE